MRTLALLAALLLLASQTQARTLQESPDRLPAQDQPVAEDQDLPGDEDQNVAISFTGGQRLAREAGDHLKIKICRCRRGLFCLPLEQRSGKCSIPHRKYTRCCR